MIGAARAREWRSIETRQRAREKEREREREGGKGGREGENAERTECHLESSTVSQSTLPAIGEP